MRYGRQRWKLKGRIEVNSRQSWDGDEMVFMPLITDLINIKVCTNPDSLVSNTLRCGTEMRNKHKFVPIR